MLFVSFLYLLEVNPLLFKPQISTYVLELPQLSYVTCHESLYHYMNIFHDMKCYSCYLAKDKMLTCNFKIFT